MVQTATVERVRERAHHVLLSDERSEILRPPFACENLIGHLEIVSVTMPCKTESDGMRTHVAAALKVANGPIEKIDEVRGRRYHGMTACNSHSGNAGTKPELGGKAEEDRKRKVTSPTLGTGGKRLWLLRSRPDGLTIPPCEEARHETFYHRLDRRATVNTAKAALARRIASFASRIALPTTGVDAT